MDDKLQRAIRESERAGHRLAPRPPDELLQALKDAVSTGTFSELVALRDWLSRFCEDVQPADDEARRLEEVAKVLDSLRRLQPPFTLGRPPWSPPWPQSPSPWLQGPVYPFSYPHSGAAPLTLPGQQYTGMPLIQPEITYHPPQTILTVSTPGLSMGTSTSGSANILGAAA